VADVWKRHHRFSTDGTWYQVLNALQVQADARGEIDWRLSVDSTRARVHQHGATAARSVIGPTSTPGAPPNDTNPHGAGTNLAITASYALAVA
jgi:transposase